MDEALRALLMDSRLSADARVIGLYVASLGPGAHEIDRDTLMDLLGSDAGKGRVQRAVAKLQRFGWVRRTEGGRGHFPRFEFRGRESEPLKQIGAAKTGSYTDRGRESEPLYENGEDSSRETAPLNAEMGGIIGGDSGEIPTSYYRDTSTAATTASADDRERAIEAMKADAVEAARQIEGSQRRAFNARVRGLVAGDDYTAWRDLNGDPIPWSERPRLLRLAMDHVVSGKVRDLRMALDRFVIPQQYDPVERRKSDELERPVKVPLPCTVEDLKALLSSAGSTVYMAAGRTMVFRRLEREKPALWARAGPVFTQLDFTVIQDINEQRKGFGLDDNLREQLDRIARERLVA